MGEENRQRLVVLGAGKVGKSSIIKQFLFGEFKEDFYKETIEDLHCREFTITPGNTIIVDILDTAGSQAFPAMRRIYLSNAHAFLLVYSIDSKSSFEEVKNIYDQIREQRGERHADLPTVVVGNKTDLEASREVYLEKVQETMQRERWSCEILETSAKENSNILQIFQKLLQQANNPAARQLSPILRRRMSERVKGSSVNGGDKAQRDNKGGGGIVDSVGGEQKIVRRSRSLIRRTSRPKMKYQPDLMSQQECIIS